MPVFSKLTPQTQRLNDTAGPDEKKGGKKREN
jgi:hypothetical protein